MLFLTQIDVGSVFHLKTLLLVIKGTSLSDYTWITTEELQKLNHDIVHCLNISGMSFIKAGVDAQMFASRF